MKPETLVVDVTIALQDDDNIDDSVNPANVDDDEPMMMISV